MKKCLISILNYNGSVDTINCVKSIYKYEKLIDNTIIILDNNSSRTEQKILVDCVREIDSSVYICTLEEYVNIDADDYNIVIVLSPINLGFAKGNNISVKSQLKNFEYIALLNNDTEIIHDSIRVLCDYLCANTSTEIVTTSIYYYDNKKMIWNAGGKLFGGTRKYYTNDYVINKMHNGVNAINAEFVTGCFLVVRSIFVKENGLFTEKFFFGEEDYEFCMRMKKKSIVMQVLLSERIYHKVGASIASADCSKYRRNFVHHLNRLIDMKSFYSRIKWNIWRCFASVYFFIFLIKWHIVTVNLAFKYIWKINTLAVLHDEVDKDLFDEIMTGKII